MAEINPPAYLQEGCYEAVQDRRLLSSIICTEGVAFGACPDDGAPNALEVVDSGTGGMNVSVSEGAAFIQGDTISCQGMYHVVNDGPVDILLTPADPVDDRTDLIIARVADSQYAGALDEWVLEDVTGTPGGGVPAAPGNALVLAEVFVAAATAEIVAGNITDRRQPYQFCPGEVPTVETFISSGTWTKPAGLKAVHVRVQGGGAGGSGTAATNSTTLALGGNGGAGGYGEEWLDASALAATVTVTVGAGSAGTSNGSAAATGGTSSFGSHCSATGGVGSGSTTETNTTPLNFAAAAGGAGGTSSSTINKPGGQGYVGQMYAATRLMPGKGGDSMFGNGGTRGHAGGASGGVNANGRGAGGGGAMATVSSGAQTGGSGTAGIVIVEMFF
jgi:hypothetical protein